MAVSLDTLQQRVVGVLIEKALTVPESYPLTMNALVAGCNQKSNRDPQMTADDFDVEGAVRSLMDSGWVARREPEGGRVHRYAHSVKQQLGVERADLAILCELLCRGPQAPGSLKTRASRMHRFETANDVEECLRDMAARPVPYVALLPKAPREQKPRWCHLLDGRTPEAARGAPAVDASEREPLAATSDAAMAPDSRAPESQALMASSPTSEMGTPSIDISALEARVTTLEDQLSALQQRLDGLL